MACEETRAVVGTRIRQLRQEGGLSQRELADQCGLTASFLSLVERGKCNPGLDSLRRIAEALNVPLLYFITRDREVEPVVRKNNRTRLTFPGEKLTYELLMPRLGNHLEMFMGRRQPGSRSPAKPPPHSSDECIFVLEGRMKIALAGKEYHLGPGDSVHFNGVELEYIEALGDRELLYICAVTPPIL